MNYLFAGLELFIRGKMERLKDLFLHGKPATILVGIKRGRGEKYASLLSKEADCTYSHAVKILNKFKESGLVEFDKQGRRKLIELTEKGERIASSMERLFEHLDGEE